MGNAAEVGDATSESQRVLQFVAVCGAVGNLRALCKNDDARCQRIIAIVSGAPTQGIVLSFSLHLCMKSYATERDLFCFQLNRIFAVGFATGERQADWRPSPTRRARQRI